MSIIATLRNMSDADAGKVLKLLVRYCTGEFVDVPDGEVGRVFLTLKNYADEERRGREE